MLAALLCRTAIIPWTFGRLVRLYGVAVGGPGVTGSVSAPSIRGAVTGVASMSGSLVAPSLAAPHLVGAAFVGGEIFGSSLAHVSVSTPPSLEVS